MKLWRLPSSVTSRSYFATAGSRLRSKIPDLNVELANWAIVEPDVKVPFYLVGRRTQRRPDYEIPKPKKAPGMTFREKLQVFAQYWDLPN